MFRLPFCKRKFSDAAWEASQSLEPSSHQKVSIFVVIMDVWGLSVSIWSFSLSSSGTEGWTRCFFFHFFGILCNQGQKIIKRNHEKIPSMKNRRMALWRICGWYLWLLTVCQYNFTASLIKALHALTRVSISNTEGKTRILDVELQNKILLCAEEKSRVVSAVCAAQALGNRCLASINILMSAPALQTTFSLSTEMSSEWRSGRSPAMRASTAWVKGEPRVSLAVLKKKHDENKAPIILNEFE